MQLEDSIESRVERLEAQAATQAAQNQEQTKIIETLIEQRNCARKEARRDNRLVRILLLCLPMVLFIFDGSSDGSKFIFRTKEVPLWIGAGFGIGVLLIVLQDEERAAIAQLADKFLSKK